MPIAILVLVFGAILSLAVWRVWSRLRLIAIAIPAGSDLETLRYKVTEAIRSFGYRPDEGGGPSAHYRAPAWQKWAVGLQDISVSPPASGLVLLTGPAFIASRIGRNFNGVVRRPYEGPQPIGPLFKGCLRMFAMLIVICAASFVVFFLVHR